MPTRPKRPCKYPCCPELVQEGYCDKHAKDKQSYDRYRGSSTERGYDAKWRKARAVYLAKHPLCIVCMKDNKITPATVVDHIKPHKGDMVLFWDRSNWQSLCKRCHDIKTATEDGGFNNPRK